VRIRIPTLFPLLGAVLVLAACAAPARPEADAEAQLKAQAEKGQVLQCEAGKEHWRADGPPKRGGVIKQALTEQPHMDPTAPGGRAYYAFGIYEYLVKPRACHFADTTMVPALVKTWEIAPGGLTWTLTLRDDAKYQNKAPLNGRPFTSADVAWTIEYLRKESDLRSYWTGTTHETPDAHRVVLRFSEPDPDFLFKIGDERHVMLPREVKEQFGDFKAVAVGTGAFQLKDFKPNQTLLAERNPSYYQTGADGKSLPYVDEMHGIVFADGAAEVAAIRANLVHHSHGSRIRKFEADALQQANPMHRYYADPAATVHGLWMNPQISPWNDVRVRRAMSLAIDRDDLIASDGGGAVHQGFVPQVLGEFAWPLEKLKEKFKSDPDQATRLLREAGFNQTADFTFATGTTYAQQIEVVAKQLQQVGIKTKIDVGSSSASGPVIRAFQHDLTWGPPGGGRFPDYWVGDLVRTGAGRNVTRYSDPKLDAMVDAQKKEMDPSRRKEVIDQIQDYLYQQMPFVPTVSRLYYGFLSCQVRNMFPNHNSYIYWGFQQAWVDQTGC